MNNTSTHGMGEHETGARPGRPAHWTLQGLTWILLLGFGIGGSLAARFWKDDLTLAWTLRNIRALDVDMDVDAYGVEFLDGGEVQVVRILHVVTEPASETQPEVPEPAVAAIH